MIKILEKKECCGCSACQQVCPKQCITMTEDAEGFEYPKIDEASCVNCRLCEKVCPIRTRKQHNVNVIESYAAYTKNDSVRLSSSSGGLFTILAEQILKKDGIVFGAAFDENFMVHHIAVDTIKDLHKLRGSKYLQSRIENTYKEAKEYLETGRNVLFSGTECQISGLKKYLRKEYDNLLTVDVLCHGVPSPKVWKRYLDWQEKTHDAAVRQTLFRSKKYGWKTFTVLLDFSNNTAYESVFTKDPFMQMFLSNICLRPSCHDCHFKEFPRQSDITLGDCWGVEQHSPEMDDDRGTSVVIINSEKGKRIKNIIDSNCNWKLGKLNTLLPVSADSRKSVQEHKNRDKFFTVLNTGGSINDLLTMLEPSLAEKIKNKIRRVKTKIMKS